MNLVAFGLVGAVLTAVATLVAAVVLPCAVRPAGVGLGTAVVGGLGLVAGIAALLGTGWSATLPGLLPLTGVALVVDPLGGVFLAVGGAVVLVAAVYGIGYSATAWTAAPCRPLSPSSPCPCCWCPRPVGSARSCCAGS